jgi:hypothetical protein
MNVNDLKPKKRIKTTDLSDPPGILAMPEYLSNRKSGNTGMLTQQVPGHEGCWWVRQDNGTYAPYWFHEMELEKEPHHSFFGRGLPFGD